MEQAECIANNLSYFKAYESIKHVSLFLLKVEMNKVYYQRYTYICCEPSFKNYFSTFRKEDLFSCYSL